MIKNTSLKAKILGGFIAASLFLLAVGGVAVYELNAISQRVHHLTDITFSDSHDVAEMQMAAMATVRNVTFLSLPGISDADVRDYLERLEKRLKQYQEAQDEYAASEDHNPAEAAIFEELTRNWDSLKKVALTMRVLAKSKSVSDRARLAEMVTHELDDAMDAYTKTVNQLIHVSKKDANEWRDLAVNSADSGMKVVVAGVSLGFLFTLALALILGTRLSRSLQAMAGELARGADEVACAARQISETSEELAAGATEQASSLQQTAASVEELSAMVKQNSDSAARSAELSSGSEEAARRGKQVVSEMVDAIGEIEKANSQISEIVKVIAQIESKTKIINDIVFKTQLLSFNASVEAARAGEHGKGFAVVAEEVGNLAQMSGNAAKEISSMLEESVEKVERLVGSSSQRVQAGSEKSKRCGEVFEELVSNVSQLNQMMREIAGASAEQSRGINEITKAMSQLDQVTQRNATASEMSATSSEQLSSEAETLRATARDLLVTVNGTSTGAPAPQHAQTKASGQDQAEAVAAVSKKVVKMSSRAKKQAPASRPNQQEPELEVPSGSDERFGGA